MTRGSQLERSLWSEALRPERVPTAPKVRNTAPRERESVGTICHSIQHKRMFETLCVTFNMLTTSWIPVVRSRCELTVHCTQKVSEGPYTYQSVRSRPVKYSVRGGIGPFGVVARPNVFG